MPKLIIISNRLPVKMIQSPNGFSVRRSEGGLATGLSSLELDLEQHWIGWPGYFPSSEEERIQIEEQLEADRIHPVFLLQEQVEKYYEGYCNSTIWPLFHYFLVYVEHLDENWKTYQEANRLFLKKTLEIASPGDIIWVHDYHLMLLPEMIRKELPSCSIGFFLHIPFPSYELFRTLTDREAILNGILGADLIGFHTYSYMRHFLSSVYRVLGIDIMNNEILTGNRVVSVDTFPMGINFKKYFTASQDPGVIKKVAQYNELYPGTRLILSVDRLDYSKGILQRLEAFEQFLEDNPGYHRKVTLILITVPSRDRVEKYHDLKTRIDEKVGHINGHYSTHGWIPIYYFYQGFSFEELAAYYYLSDVALVTPLRDGMNLVAKEYIATKANQPGVLILSEMAGAAAELNQALMVNPNNIREISRTLLTALEMPPDEQLWRISAMQKILERQNVNVWASSFISELVRMKQLREKTDKKYLRTGPQKELARSFRKAERSLFLLDYDGTLVPFASNPDQALPDKNILSIIDRLSRKPGVDLVIISGRTRQFLDTLFRDYNVILVAEHGAWIRKNYHWEKVSSHSSRWKKDILSIMQTYTDKTPGSFIEVKDTAIVWHYRKVDAFLAELRTNQLIHNLLIPCNQFRLQLMRGKKIIEVKMHEFSKGSIVTSLLAGKFYEFILAAGDDATDEEMFSALPVESVSIKIGDPSQRAGFYLRNHHELITLLERMIPGR